jgi:hypothetical protein
MIKASTVPSTVESSHPIPVGTTHRSSQPEARCSRQSPNVLWPVPLEAGPGTAQALKQF